MRKIHSSFLKGKLIENHITQTKGAELLDMAQTTFNAKINQTRGFSFTLIEFLKLMDILKINDLNDAIIDKQKQ